jgi:hypothetical protein
MAHVNERKRKLPLRKLPLKLKLSPLKNVKPNAAVVNDPSSR